MPTTAFDPPDPPAAPPPLAVLDTNVVLDWLVFGHPSSLPIAAAIAGGHLRWLASPGARDELAHVLAHGQFTRWRPDLDRLWATWQRFAVVETPRPVQGPASRLRCTDPDDQKFLDLACGHGAAWLLSRDRALLKLARRARASSLQVVTPEEWAERFQPHA